MSGICIQKVKALDLSKLFVLVEESKEEGFRHLERLVRDYETGANRFDKVGESLFIAYYDEEIVGVCRLNRDPYTNSKGTGRVRRLYVSPRVRRFGIGRMLVESVIMEARNYYEMLVLRTDNAIAAAFYCSIGFLEKKNAETNTHFLRFN